MGARDFINRHPTSVIGVLVGLLIVLVWFTLHSGAANAVPTTAYFTADDGKTWFVDSIDRITPFELDGKQVDRAFVYSGNGKKFVAYMTRLSAAGLMIIKDNGGKYPAVGTEAFSRVQASREFKKPGDTKWICPGRDMQKLKPFVQVSGNDGEQAEPVSP